MITLIAAIGKNNEIGKNNTLLWDLPRDMQHFRNTTKEKIVVMGRKTFESIGHPLPNRRNIVLSKNKKYKPKSVEVVHEIETIVRLSKKKNEEEIMIIGGDSIYTLFIPYADRLLLTCVQASFPDADTFFPSIENDNWEIIFQEKYKKDSEHKYDFTIVEMQRINFSKKHK